MDGGGGGGSGDAAERDELVQPSFNDRLTIIDFSHVGAGGGAGDSAGDSAAAGASSSPAGVSLHTPTPPQDIGDADPTPFSFELVAVAAAAPSFAHYEPSRWPTTVTVHGEYLERHSD